MAVKYVCLGQVSLQELGQQGLFPVAQLRRDGQFWVALDPGISDSGVAAKLAALGFREIEWERDQDVWFLKAQRAREAEDIKPLEPQHKTQIRSWLGSTDAGFRENLTRLIDQILIPAVKRNVNLWVPHNTTRDPIYGPEFNIFVWASPTPVDEGWTAPERIFGKPLGARQDHRFGKWAEGIPVTTPEGDEIGAVDGNNLFIYADLVHAGNELAIWKQLLGEVIKVLATTDETFDPVQARKLYVGLCGNRLTQQIRMTETAVTVTRGEIDEANKTLATKLRHLEKLNLELTAMAAATQTGQSKFEQEFDSLLKIPKIKAVAFRGSMLVISTDTLNAKNPASGRMHEIGKFKFITDTERGTVKILNQTRLVNGYRPRMQAPHVFPDGRPCLGNLEATIPQLVAGYEFSALAQILIAYVESVNLDDGAGRYIERWPRIMGDRSIQAPDGGAHEIRILSIEDMRSQTREALEAHRARVAAEAEQAPVVPAEEVRAAAAATPAGAGAHREIVTDPQQWHEEAT